MPVGGVFNLFAKKERLLKYIYGLRLLLLILICKLWVKQYKKE